MSCIRPRDHEAGIREDAMDRMTRAILSPDEVAAYDRDGFVVPRYRLSAQKIDLLRRLTMELVEKNREHGDRMLSCPHVQRPFVPDAYPHLKTPNHREWMSLATDPDILDMVEQLIGPDMILWSSAVFYKRPAGGPATPWHSDASFLPIKPTATASVWIAVCNSTTENSCLRFIPGSHRQPLAERHVHTDRADVIFPNSLPEDAVEEAAAQDVELEAGRMVLFDVHTVHGARPNDGTRPRAGFSIRFMPATSHFDHDARPPGRDPDPYRIMKDKDYATRPLFLVRGRDVSGHNDFRRGHPS
jgi:ectoine hydroxylase-related dioxygenase (phytanoyl-CoA dioxygenase family)